MKKVTGVEAWVVLDTTTGLPAVVNGVPQMGLPLDDADDLTDLQSTGRRGSVSNQELNSNKFCLPFDVQSWPVWAIQRRG